MPTNTLKSWSPPQWANGVAATLTMIAPPVNGSNVTTLYVFDAVTRVSHAQDTVTTKNPVQTQASITDHAYNAPARVTAEIVMSDSMSSYIIGQWSGAGSRSVAAYQTLLELQAAHVLLQLSTRLRRYSNMLIVEVRPEETVETRLAMRCTVVFEEILLASLGINATGQAVQSARSDATGGSQSGLTQPTPVPPAVTMGFSVESSTFAQRKPTSTVPNAGNYSSTPINSALNAAASAAQN